MSLPAFILTQFGTGTGEPPEEPPPTPGLVTLNAQQVTLNSQNVTLT